MVHHSNFFDWNIDASLAYIETYNVTLVITSYLIATLAGYCALSFSAFISEDRTSKHRILQVVGGISLGLGIWAMHFTGMLAMALPVPTRYELAPTLISILPAIVISIIALIANANPSTSLTRFFATSLLLTAGIAAMHYQGMTAMSVNATMVHDPIGFTFAVLISWLLAMLTVFIQYSDHRWVKSIPIRRKSLISASTYGFSVASMHYIAMNATYFFPIEQNETLSGLPAEALSFSIILAVLLLVCMLSVILFYRKKILVLVELASSHHIQMVETIDNMADPFLLCDQNNTVLLVNNSFVRTFPEVKALIDLGVKVPELLTFLIEHEFIFDSDKHRDRVIKKMQLNRALFLPHINGSWWHFRQSRSPSGNVMQTWTNVTEYKESERRLLDAKNESQAALIRLQQTQDELVESQRQASVGRLVANVAHELNTPLGVAITSLSSINVEAMTLTEKLNSGSLTKSNMASALSLISEFELLASKNVDRAHSIVKQFKFISLDQQTELPTTVNLLNTCKHVITLLEDKIAAQHIQCQINIDEHIELVTYQDALFQVLNAIVDNSVSHAFVDVITPTITFNAILNKDELTIDIIDNGVGVPDLISDILFDPFVTSKRSQGHIGLGLHIAYNLTTEHIKGKVELLQSDANGSHFRLTLPIQISQLNADAISL